MKTYKLIAFLAAMVFTFSACETEVEDPAGERGVGLVTTITGVDPAIFVDGDLDISYVQFTANAQTDATFDEAYVVVSFNGVSQRQRLKDIASFPSVINITAVEAVTALGMSIGDVEAQDYFVFEIETKVGGKITRSNGGLTVRVVCPFDEELSVGSYTAVSAAWGVNGGITLVADEADPYTIYVSGLCTIDGVVEDLGPLVMHINPFNFKVVADKTVLASVVTWNPAYTNMAYAGTGEYNSCTGSYTMLFNITVDQGSFGNFAFTFTKN